jgi:histidinol-phosphatase (PHP family)
MFIMIYKTDYHIHTTYSDGKADPEEYIGKAISAGINEIGFSDHLNIFFSDEYSCIKPDSINEYISHLNKIKRSTPGFIIKTGLEVDYFPGKEEEIYNFVHDLDLDYIIGSVHFLGEKTPESGTNYVESGPAYYENRDIDELFENYFAHVIGAVESGLFDIIAHCDLVRYYNFRPKANPEYLYRRLANKMKVHDVVFEINTNGRNRPVGDFYPDRRFLKVFSEEKVPVCVNSDAHIPDRVGQHFDEAYNLLKEAGFKEMAVFSNRERFLVPADF